MASETHRKPTTQNRTRGRQGATEPLSARARRRGESRVAEPTPCYTCSRGWASPRSPHSPPGSGCEPLQSWKMQRDLKPHCPLGHHWRTLDRVVKNLTVLHSDWVAARQIFSFLNWGRSRPNSQIRSTFWWWGFFGVHKHYTLVFLPLHAIRKLIKFKCYLMEFNFYHFVL